MKDIKVTTAPKPMDVITHIKRMPSYISQYYEEIEFYLDPASLPPSPCQLELYNFITARKYNKQQLLVVTDGGAIPAQVGGSPIVLHAFF